MPGLLVQPQISVKLNGIELEVTQDAKNNTYTAKYPSDDALLAEQQSYIMTNSRKLW